MTSRLDSLYNLVNHSVNAKGVYDEAAVASQTSWSDIFRQVRRDTGAGFRDLTTYVTGSRKPGDSKSVVNFIDSAVAARNRSKASTVGTNKYYYMSTLVPGGNALFSYMNILTTVYDREEAASPGILFKTLGIEKPIATALDDRIEKMFMLYLYSSIEHDADAIPRPYESDKTDRLSPRWRKWIRKKLDTFLCSAMHVRINTLEGKCSV